MNAFTLIRGWKNTLNDNNMNNRQFDTEAQRAKDKREERMMDNIIISIITSLITSLIYNLIF